MAKIVLGKRPQSFKHVVKFPMLDGTQGAIEVTYKYRTRTEFGQFIDKIMADAGVDKPADGEVFSLEKLMEKTAGSNADYLLQVLEGWDLDVALSHESAQQLADEIPGAANAIMESYRAAITEGRLGN